MESTDTIFDFVEYAPNSSLAVVHPHHVSLDQILAFYICKVLPPLTTTPIVVSCSFCSKVINCFYLFLNTYIYIITFYYVSICIAKTVLMYNICMKTFMRVYIVYINLITTSHTYLVL
jgi:hypothetical protein